MDQFKKWFVCLNLVWHFKLVRCHTHNKNHFSGFSWKLNMWQYLMYYLCMATESGALKHHELVTGSAFLFFSLYLAHYICLFCLPGPPKVSDVVGTVVVLFLQMMKQNFVENRDWFCFAFLIWSFVNFMCGVGGRKEGCWPIMFNQKEIMKCIIVSLGLSVYKNLEFHIS